MDFLDSTDSPAPMIFADRDSAPIAWSFRLGSGAMRAVVKDNFAIAGIPTSMGSARFARGEPAGENAVVVDRLIENGVTVIGRAKMHELAYGVTGRNDWAGTPLNPRWPDRIVGGSSSGCAAAVAAGLVDFAIGTDTGGSIRMPAACCGIVGLKPSFGFVSRQGVLPATSSLDCVGPMASGVRGVETAMAAMADDFARVAEVKRPRMGILKCNVDDDIAQAFEQAIAAVDSDKKDVELGLFEDAFQAGLTIIGAEMWAEFSGLAPDFNDIGEDVATRLRRTEAIDAVRLRDAEAVRRGFTEQLDEVFEAVDFLLLPTLPCVPPLCAQAEDPLAQLRLTSLIRPFNVSGHPALTIPILTSDGLPAAVQIVGRMGQDASLCAVGRMIETQITKTTERIR